MPISRLSTLLLVAALVAACGKKGALQLPDQPPPAPPTQEEPKSK
jgi:predicted small lipoprotein YifL